MFLITTADQRFWQTGRPVVFLGEWCKRYDQRHVWNAMNSETLPYHWDDRSRLYSDYRYLEAVYEKYLQMLAPKLNEIHGTSQSPRFWRIVLGPWLRYFIEIFYDRYLSICAAADHGLISDTLVTEIGRFQPPLDFPEFNRYFISDSYNHYLYSWLIQATKPFPFRIHSEDPRDDRRPRTATLRDQIIRIISRLSRAAPASWNPICLFTTQLPKFELIRLNLALGQFPWVVGPPIAVTRLPTKEHPRKRLALHSGQNAFEKLLDVIIPEQIPVAHVEAFDDLRSRALRAFPDKPKLIVTSVAETYDEGFKVWTAGHVDKGAAFSVSQHGGFFGAGLWMSSETHQIKISNRYYSWGWCDENSHSIKPMSALKLVGIQRRIRRSDSGRILWAVTSMSRYSYRMLSMPVAGQFLAHMKDEFRLAKALPPEIRRKITLRLYPDTHGWDEDLRWRAHFPDLEIYNGRSSMERQLSESSLLISTYHGTAFLETLAADFPTIIFWDPCYWELRESAKPFFDLLRDAGIFHTEPESAALKIEEVSNIPMNWWRLPKVQNARREFCKRFAHTSAGWLREWKSELEQFL